MDLSCEDLRQIDINFENISFAVAVPKQKGKAVNHKIKVDKLVMISLALRNCLLLS